VIDSPTETDESPDGPRPSMWVRFRAWVRKPKGISAIVFTAVCGAAAAYYLPGAFQGGGRALHIVSSPGPLSVDATPVDCGDPSPSVLDPWWLFPAGTTPEGARFPQCGPRLDEWAPAHHGIPADHLIYRITVRANQATPVIVNGITVSVESSGPPSSGWYVWGAGCGPVTARLINVDFDQSPPTVDYAMDANHPEDLSRTFNLSVSQDDPEVLYLVATTTTSEVVWRPYLQYEFGDHQSSIALTPDPLRITAVSAADHSYSDSDRSRTPSDDGKTTFC
jgi:hypothetical protein